MFFSEDGKKLFFLLGVGVCELVLSFFLKKILNSVKDLNLLLVLEILSSVLRVILRFFY